MPTTEEELKLLFSQRLSLIMQQRDINQVELSKILGVSESTVGKWLLKKAMPRMGVIQKLANYFNVGKSYFHKRCNKSGHPHGNNVRFVHKKSLLSYEEIISQIDCRQRQR